MQNLVYNKNACFIAQRTVDKNKGAETGDIFIKKTVEIDTTQKKKTLKFQENYEEATGNSQFACIRTLYLLKPLHCVLFRILLNYCFI